MIKIIKRTIRNILYIWICKLLPKPIQTIYKDQSVGIVSLLCHRDVTKYIYTTTSFFYQLGFQLPLFVVDDGTLTNTDKDNLSERFDIRIEDKYELDENIAKKYHPYQYLYRNRFLSNSHIYKMKIDALVLSPFERTILMDSDILFFHKPTIIINWIKSNSEEILHFVHKKKDIHKGIFASQLELTCRTLLKRYKYTRMNIDFNSGLVCIPHKSIINLQLLNSIFKTYFSLKIEEDLIVTEEIAVSIMCSIYKERKVLDPKKYIVSALGIDYSPHLLENAICIHYAASSTDRFYKDSLICVYKELFSKSV